MPRKKVAPPAKTVSAPKTKVVTKAKKPLEKQKLRKKSKK
jgi:hypothetical protein